MMCCMARRSRLRAEATCVACIAGRAARPASVVRGVDVLAHAGLPCWCFVAQQAKSMQTSERPRECRLGRTAFVLGVVVGILQLRSVMTLRAWRKRTCRCPQEFFSSGRCAMYVWIAHRKAIIVWLFCMQLKAFYKVFASLSGRCTSSSGIGIHRFTKRSASRQVILQVGEFASCALLHPLGWGAFLLRGIFQFQPCRAG